MKLFKTEQIGQNRKQGGRFKPKDAHVDIKCKWCKYTIKGRDF